MHYYRRDHLGSIREVWRAAYTVGSTTYPDTTLQRTQYYPSGLPWAESYNANLQQRKYNGKEWIETHGLDEYYSFARNYYPAIQRTTTMDELCEEFYHISPYAWSENNPVNNVDLDGRYSTKAAAERSRWWYNLWHKNDAGDVKQNEHGQYYYVTTSKGKEQNEVVVTYNYGKEGVKGETNNSEKANVGVLAIPRIKSTPTSRILINPFFLGVTAITLFTSYTPVPTKEEFEYYNATQQKDNSKNERHGDGGRAKSKVEQQIKELEEKAKSTPNKKEREKINRKIKNIRENAERKAKGEEHSRSSKR